MSGRKGFLGSVLKLGRATDTQKPKPFAPFLDVSKIESCSVCDDIKCVKSCSRGIIVIENKIPVLNFYLSGCDMCGECFDSCPQGLFSVLENAKIDALISLDPYLCMAYRGTICRSCFDPCLEKAINFAGLFYPQIDEAKCTACGFCIKVCPAQAITVSRSLV